MEVCGLQGSKAGLMDDHIEEESDIGSMSSLSCGDDEDELKDEATTSLRSSLSSFPSSSASSSSFSINEQVEDEEEGPFLEMNSLISILPLKRGLSKHYDGKSQSFTSLSDIKCLEDLIKPERPYRKKLKTSQSYGGGLDGFNPLSPKASTTRGAITKKSSWRNTPFSSLSSRRHHILAGKPPVPPQRSASNLSSQTLLFAHN